MGEKGQFFLPAEFQLINTNGTKEQENHHVSKSSGVITKSKNHQGMLTWVSGSMWRNKTISKHASTRHWEVTKETGAAQWRHLAGATSGPTGPAAQVSSTGHLQLLPSGPHTSVPSPCFPPGAAPSQWLSTEQALGQAHSWGTQDSSNRQSGSRISHELKLFQACASLLLPSSPNFSVSDQHCSSCLFSHPCLYPSEALTPHKSFEHLILAWRLLLGGPRLTDHINQMMKMNTTSNKMKENGGTICD